MTERSVQLGAWLRVARAQERDRGVDFRELACYATKLTPHIKDHLAPALQDLECLYAELPPGVVEEEEQREFWEEFRPEYIRRIAVAISHIGAALAAVGCTDEELEGQQSGPGDEVEGDQEPEADESSEDDEEPDETVHLSLADIREAVDQNA